MASSLLPPPETLAAPASPPPCLPHRAPLSRERPRRAHPGRSPGALSLSLLLHGAALILVASFFRFGSGILPEGGGGGSETVLLELRDFPRSVPDGIFGAAPVPDAGDPAAEQLSSSPSQPATDAAPGASATSAPRPAPAAGTFRPGTGSGGGAGSAGTGGTAGERAGAAAGGSSAGRLGGGWRDPRLIPAPRELPPERELSDHERYMAQLEARLGVWNDSVAGDAERARRATDWTRTDKNGKKWGVSPGKIHLGGITLPTPVGFAPSPAREEEGRERTRQRAEIDRQVDDAARRAAREEQKRSARERADRERAERRGDGP